MRHLRSAETMKTYDCSLSETLLQSREPLKQINLAIITSQLGLGVVNV